MILVSGISSEEAHLEYMQYIGAWISMTLEEFVRTP
jgi:hypothetical protein